MRVQPHADAEGCAASVPEPLHKLHSVHDMPPPGLLGRHLQSYACTNDVLHRTCSVDGRRSPRGNKSNRSIFSPSTMSDNAGAHAHVPLAPLAPLQAPSASMLECAKDQGFSLLHDENNPSMRYGSQQSYMRRVCQVFVLRDAVLCYTRLSLTLLSVVGPPLRSPYLLQEADNGRAWCRNS